MKHARGDALRVRLLALALLVALGAAGVAAYDEHHSSIARSHGISEVTGPPEGPGGVLRLDDATMARLPAPTRAAFAEALREGHATFTVTRAEAARLDEAFAEAAAAQGITSVGFHEVQGRAFRMGQYVA